MNQALLIQYGIIFGSISMLSWGIADIFYAHISRRLGNISAVIFSSSSAAVILTFYLLFTHTPVIFTTSAIFTSVLAGIIHTAANYAFSVGLSRGKIALVSPVAAGYSIILVLAAILFYGETLSLFQISAIFIVIFGTIIASADISKLFKSKKLVLSDPGIPYAFAAFFLWGLGFLVLNQVIKQTSWVLPNLVIFFTQPIIIYLYALITKQKIKLPKTPKLTFSSTVIGFFAAGGYIGYSLGIQKGLASLTAPVAAAFPAITVVLARILFKEKITPLQTFGIIAIISGVILLST